MKPIETALDGGQQPALATKRRRVRVFDSHVCPAARIKEGPPPILHRLTTLQNAHRIADYRRDWERTMHEYFAPEEAPELRGAMIMESLQYSAFLGPLGARLLRRYDLTTASLREVDDYESLARSEPLVQGFTAYADLSAGPVAFREFLALLSEHRLVRGVRFFLYGLSDQQLIDHALLQALRLVGKHGMTFLAHFSLGQAPAVARMMALCPDVKFSCFVVQPPEGVGASEYRQQWGELAAVPNCFPKLTLSVFRRPQPGYAPAVARARRVYNGLRGRSVMIARPERDGPWIVYPRIAAELFGPMRLMYASDWPWRTQFALPAEQIYYLNEMVFHGCSESELDAFYGGNAARFFG
jgi:predicted TIM-barrel fold metal-dependent hydrolase